MSHAREAFVTLATSDAYAIGALVLAHSIKLSGTTRDLVVMIPPSGISGSLEEQLYEAFNHVERVDLLDSKDELNLALLSRPDLGVTFTKLHCWRLTQYEKAVFIDADCLVIQNIDDLFQREEFSAAPDPGWPDCFNSGVFVFRPSDATYKSLLDFAAQQGSFDGGDQGLLNLYFNDWSTKDIARHLPFVYNCVSHTFYSYLPAFVQFRGKVRVVHFIGSVKPWHHEINPSTGQVIPHRDTVVSVEFLQRWWNIFFRHVQPKMTRDAQGIAGSLARLDAPSAESIIIHHGTGSDRDRQYAWERNEIDYTGTDRFDNILNKIKDSMSQGPKE
jgi:glycogenin glucosyltransferase